MRVHAVYNEFNVLTLILVLFAVAITMLLTWILWRWMIKEMARLREELPRAIIGVMITREDFGMMWERIAETEAKLENVEARLDVHLGISDNDE